MRARPYLLVARRHRLHHQTAHADDDRRRERGVDVALERQQESSPPRPPEEVPEPAGGTAQGLLLGGRMRDGEGRREGRDARSSLVSVGTEPEIRLQEKQT